MRVLLIAAVVCFILALICTVAPTTVLTADGTTWTIAGLLAWSLDNLVGGKINIS